MRLHSPLQLRVSAERGQAGVDCAAGKLAAASQYYVCPAELCAATEQLGMPLHLHSKAMLHAKLLASVMYSLS